MDKELSPQLRLILGMSELAKQRKSVLFLVGGIVRDIFLGHLPDHKDVDFVVEGDAMAFARQAALTLGGKEQEFKDFGTAKVTGFSGYEGIKEVDFATARTETYEAPGVLPDVRPASIHEDLKRRDFTCNALAVKAEDLAAWWEKAERNLDALYASTIDLFEGRKDLDARVIRVLHAKSFADDPTRIFRAARYAARFDATLDAQTREYVEEALTTGHCLATLSHTRVLNEIKKICFEKTRARAFRLLDEWGILAQIPLFPLAGREEIFAEMDRFAASSEDVTQEAMYEMLMRLCYNALDESERQEKFAAFGFGKKSFARFAKK